MFHVTLATICIFICTVHSTDKFCAWNRAVKSLTQNNAETYNYINGDFTRWYDFFSGDLWHGQPYYRMTLTSCFVTNLYLYRYQDFTSFPPNNTWVIGANMGQPPIYGYAYCNIDSGLQSRPDGNCDHNWMIGDPQDDQAGQTAAHEADQYFYVISGGCPQITCSTLEFSDNKNDDWAGTFTYYQPNIYRQTGRSDTSETGEWYLFFNPKVWTWAINEAIDDYEVCENYKLGKGFTSVANVIPGDASNTIKYADEFWYYTPSTGSSRAIDCIGTTPTPAPTTEQSWEPTVAPLTIDYCAVQWTVMAASAVEKVLAQCGCTQNMQDLGHCTPQPTVSSVVTTSPTPAPQAAPVATPEPAASSTPEPASQPASQPSPTTAAPTSPGTAKPTGPTTASPTDQNGSARPTTGAPTSPGTAKPTAADGAATFNGSAYLLAIVLAVYRLF